MSAVALAAASGGGEIMGFSIGWVSQLAWGALATLQISAGAFAVGIAIGVLVAAIKLRGGRWSSPIAHGYSTLCRAVPEVLLVILAYYAGQVAINTVCEWMGREPPGLSGAATAIVVLGLVQGAYASEVVRGAYLAIPRGQIEAAHAFGFHGRTLWWRIALPAMLPYALGGLVSLWMVLLKDSALVSIVGYPELLSAGKQAAGSTRHYFRYYLLVAAMYYAMAVASAWLVRRIEARIRRWLPPLGPVR